MSSRFFDRAIRSSVDRAMRMQPRRTRRVAEETLYASPAQRQLIEEIRLAARSLVMSGLGVPGAAFVAARRSDGRVVMTRPDADLMAVDNRRVQTAEDSDPPVLRRLAEAATHAGSAVWCHPSETLALASLGFVPDPSLAADLAALAGEITVGSENLARGVSVLPGEGVLATADRPEEAVIAAQAAERLAAITARRRLLADPNKE